MDYLIFHSSIHTVLYYEPELWLKLKRDGWLCHCHRRGGADG